MKKTLFGLDKGGSYKVWTIEVVGDSYTVSHGLEFGKMQFKTNKVKGKNIGRANETTPVEQAILEAQSKVNKQIDKGYREDKADLGELDIMPMLAHDYHKQGHRIKYPCIGSPKLDGVRCLAEKEDGVVTLKSRGGKFYSVPHVQKALGNMMVDGQKWDGELYVHGYALEQIVSAVKRLDAQEKANKAKDAAVQHPNDVEKQTEYAAAMAILALRNSMQFHVFDIVSDKEYGDRVQDLIELEFAGFNEEYVEVVPIYTIEDDEHMKRVHSEMVNRGYEGIMLRNTTGVYESGKRSADLQKYKTFLDEEFLVTRVLQDKDGRGVLECWCDVAEAHFTVTFGSHADREHQVAHPEEYVHKLLTVQFQTRYKDSLLPQFGTGKMLREGRFVDGQFYPDI